MPETLLFVLKNPGKVEAEDQREGIEGQVIAGRIMDCMPKNGISLATYQESYFIWVSEIMLQQTSRDGHSLLPAIH
jgi:hypothetical protein